MLTMLLLASTHSHAAYYWGNPTLGFRVDRPADDYVEGTVFLDKVRVHHCGGGSTDYEIDAVVDPVAGYQLVIAGGDHCDVTYFWGSDMDIDGDGFTVRYSADTTNVELSEEISPVALTPYSVVSGSMSGGAPWLLMSID